MAEEMGVPSLQRKKTDPTLSDTLDLHKRDIFLSLNCHAIGTIQSFDAENQTCTATINYKKSYLRAGLNGVYSNVLVDYPILVDVPVIVLSGGPAQITFPIQVGDTCLILFNDRSIDEWFASGQVGPISSTRLHSMSDGIALVGLRSLANSIQNYDSEHAGVSWGDTKLMVSAEKLLLANAVESLNDILQDLLTQIQALTVICASPGNPSSVPVNAAAFAAIATRLGALLE